MTFRKHPTVRFRQRYTFSSKMMARVGMSIFMRADIFSCVHFSPPSEYTLYVIHTYIYVYNI